MGRENDGHALDAITRSRASTVPGDLDLSPETESKLGFSLQDHSVCCPVLEICGQGSLVGESHSCCPCLEATFH